MQNKKTALGLVLLILLSTSVGVVVAGSVDFSAQDYQRALNGDKNLVEGRLEGSDFHGKDLSGTNFTNADLEKANFAGANLTGAIFKHADLEGANLRGANLTKVNFEHADLEEANLKGATMKDVILKNTELEYTTWFDGRVCGEGSLDGCW